MQLDKLTPEQIEALNKVKSLFQTASETIKDAFDIAEKYDLQDTVLIFSILETSNVTASGDLDDTCAVNRSMWGDGERISESLASLAESQETPWLCKAYKNAASDALDNKVFEIAQRLGSAGL